MDTEKLLNWLPFAILLATGIGTTYVIKDNVDTLKAAVSTIKLTQEQDAITINSNTLKTDTLVKTALDMVKEQQAISKETNTILSDMRVNMATIQGSVKSLEEEMSEVKKKVNK